MEPHIVRQGEPSGSGMVVRWRTDQGFEFHAIGVTNPLSALLGPTWVYVLSLDKLTLLDTGMVSTFDSLEDGLHVLGLSAADVGRVIVSHGHPDHDGNVPEMAHKVGPDVWAHEVYPSLIRLDRYQIEFQRFGHLYNGAGPADHVREHMAQYKRERKNLSGIHPVRDGDRLGPLTFLHMPGHSPDELCIVGPGVVFSGDHVLPEITPHPTSAAVYHDFEPFLPSRYRERNRSYGLKIYLQSLRRTLELDPHSTIMPAHRLFFDGKFNMVGLRRAQEIIDHHVQRCHAIIEQVRGQPKSVNAITGALFDFELLEGRGFQLALTEMIAHLELLKEAGDVLYEDGTFEAVRWTGTERFRELINLLQPVL